MQSLLKPLIVCGFLLGVGIFVGSCQNNSDSLPILGERTFINGDSVYHTIPDFKFINHDGQEITNKNFEGKIYVADFFFTTCPTICPVMKKQLIRVYEKYKDNPAVGILSHTIDPRHDSVEVLKEYAARLGVKGNMWQFVTGEKSKLYEIGEKSYYVTVGEDSTAAGGILHSGAFILVDKKRHVRGLYDGTNEEAVSKLVKDIETLLKEQ